MNTREITDRADVLAENGVLKLLGRVAMAASAPAIIWLGVTLWDISREQGRLQGKLDLLVERIDRASEDRYRAGDAIRDFKLRDQKDRQQDLRIDRNERRIDGVEQRRYGAPQ